MLTIYRSYRGNLMKNKNYPTMKPKSNILSKKSVFLWRVRATSVFIIAAFFVGASYAFSPITAVVGGIVMSVVYLTVILVYLPILYSSCQYSMTDSFVAIEKGVIFRKHMQISYSRIQYCVLVQGPLQRIFGLCTVRLLTAGSFEIMRDISLINGKKIKRMSE